MSWFERIVEMTPEAIFVIEDGRHVFANPAGLALFGADCLEQISDRPAVEFLDEEFRAVGQTRALVAQDGECTDFLRERVIRLDGTRRETEGATAPVLFEGRPATLALARDVTARVASEAARRQAESRFVAAVTGAPTGIGLLDDRRRIVMANDAMGALCETATPDGSGCVNRKLRDLVEPAYRDEFDGLFRPPAPHGDGDAPTTCVRLVGAPDRSIEVSLRRLALDGAAQYVVLMHDITRQKDHEADLIRRARIDDLTGLPNRSAFTDAMARALADKHAHVAVAFCDIDNFKTVNDSLGHGVGDELLVAVGRRLQSAVRTDDVLARFGGDEFVLLVRNAREPEQVDRIIERLMATLEEPFTLTGCSVHVTASIGVAFGLHGSRPADLLGDADAAMYDAKANGRARYELADVGQRERAKARLEIEQSFRIALANDELQPHFQPIVDLATGRIVAVEALARWESEGTPIPPSTFIPVAEAIGLVGRLDRHMIRQSARQLRCWVDAGLVGETFRVSANITPAELADDDLFDTLEHVLAETDLGCHRVVLELTERMTMATAGCAAGIDRLERMGIGLALDDFGIGESSLARLSEMPFDVLKLDRSFTAGAVTSDRSTRLLAGVVKLGHSLGQVVLAEGVETREQLDLLRHCGVDLAQGYLLARPAPAAVVTELLAADRPLFDD